MFPFFIIIITTILYYAYIIPSFYIIISITTNIIIILPLLQTPYCIISYSISIILWWPTSTIKRHSPRVCTFLRERVTQQSWGFNLVSPFDLSHAWCEVILKWSVKPTESISVPCLLIYCTPQYLPYCIYDIVVGCNGLVYQGGVS